MQKATAAFCRKEDHFISATKTLSTPGGEPFTFRLLPDNGSPERLPTHCLTRLFEKRKQINVPEHEEISARYAHAKAFREDCLKDRFCNFRCVGIVVVLHCSRAKATGVHILSVMRGGDNQVNETRVERGKHESHVAMNGANLGGRRSVHAVAAADHFRLEDRKSTRLNSSHSQISYAVFCF